MSSLDFGAWEDEGGVVSEALLVALTFVLLVGGAE